MHRKPSYTAHDTATSHRVVYSDRSGTILDSQESTHPARSGIEIGEVISKKKVRKARKERAEDNGPLAMLPHTKPGAKVRDYDAHVLVCKGGDCKKRGSKAVRTALKDQLRDRGRVGDVRIDSVDCLGLCKHGPNAVVYPGGVWYVGLREGDVPEVVERHLEGGEPVERLAAGFRPHKRKK
jgi:(2Fe-2S) ferredoxin